MPKFQLVRDPRLFLKHWKPVEDPGLRLALGLDLATTTGYAYTYFVPGEPYEIGGDTTGFGQWDLSAGPYDSGAIRFVRLRQFLAVVRPAIVFYEDSKYVPAEKPNLINMTAILARAARSIGLLDAFKAAVGSWCEAHDVPCQGIPIGAIKKRATGRGNADKPAVIEACNALFHAGLEVEGYESSGVDNVADACFCLLLGIEGYSMGVPEEPPRKKSKRRIHHGQNGPPAGAR
jgi:hypothetical protein